MKILFCLNLVLAVPALCISADVVVYDHFDDGALDPSWDIVYTNATGWTYQEAGTELTVTDIAAGVTDDWNRITLGRDCKALKNFKTTLVFSWDSENSGAAMQLIQLYLRDSAGRLIAGGGMSDAWIYTGGRKWGLFGDNSYYSAAGSMPLAGSATLEIERTEEDGSGQVLWDGEKLIDGKNIYMVERIEISFGYYCKTGSLFGTEAVDLVSLEGEDPSLKNHPIEISAATGGASVFHLDAGVANANRDYIILGSITNSYPYYIPLPGGSTKLYLRWDLFTMIIIDFINTPTFANFLGQSDGLGRSTATLNLPALDPALAGQKMYFAYAMNAPWNFASNSVVVDIIP